MLRGRWRRAATAAAAAAVAVLVVSSAAIARPDSGRRQALTGLKVAYGNQTIDFMQLVVAQKAGIFARNGLDVSLVNGTGSKGPTLLAANQADIAVSDGPTFMAANAKGADLDMLSVDLNRYTFKLVGSKSIANVKGLVGHTLALSSPGGSVDVAGRAMLENAGLSPSQVKIVYISDVPSRLAALNGGSVDAMIASPPVSPVLKNPKLHLIYDLLALRQMSISSWATSSWAKANVDTIKRYIRADVQAIAYMQAPAHAAQVKQWIADWTGFTDSDSVEEGYKVLLKEFQPEPLPDPKALQIAIQTTKAKTGAEVDPNSFLFLGPLQQVLTYRLGARMTAAQQVPRAKRAHGSAVVTGTLDPQGRLAWKVASTKGLTGKISRIELYVGAPGKVGKAALEVCHPCAASGRKPVGNHPLQRQIKAGQTYVVIQTAKNPRGEVRGQLEAKLG